MSGLPMLVSSLGLASAQTPEKPNVVFILADDLGYGDVGCYGQKIIQTPNIDKLAQSGMMMMDFYAGCTVSAPSRASLMTGLHTGHTKVRGNKEILPEGQLPMAERETLGSIFQKAGYATGIFGKWGLGFPGSGAEPLDRGFDTFYGYNCQREAHLYFPEHLYQDRTKTFLPLNIADGREQYAPDLIQRNAVEFIKGATERKQPFFAMLTYTLPHAELNLPHDAIYEMYEGKVTPKPWDGGGYSATPDAHRSFAAMITKLDQYVGEVMQLVKDLGQEDNTIFIFTSDNGPHLEGGADPDYFNSNGPLRGYKRDLYEGGVREPMIISWKGKIQPGSRNTTPAAFWDILPTMAEIAGTKAPTDLDGKDLLPLWLGKKNTLDQDRPLYWEFHAMGGKQALRYGKWKLVVLNVDKEPVYELYDLSKDLGEEHNLAGEMPQEVERLKAILEREHRPSQEFPFKAER